MSTYSKKLLPLFRWSSIACGLIVLLSCTKKENITTIDTSGGKAAAGADLGDPAKKEIAMQLVASAENSTLDWRGQFQYVEDIKDGRGYTTGIVGFTTGTGDVLQLVNLYQSKAPGNVLSAYLPALIRVNGSDSHAGLDPGFPAAWRQAAKDTLFQQIQVQVCDSLYFFPARELAKKDGLNILGQFIYFDAAVMHGYEGLEQIRNKTLLSATTPAAGGGEEAYLEIFLNNRVTEMKKEAAHDDVSRVEGAQRKFLREHNLSLTPPLKWKIYDVDYSIK
ncbi:chitosanase [Chitinophaga arvensicola]|uniref:Chitosanase n=1 Tax=Chitinophaga arvensicola TaxID=29529 RepID=A0A1I0SB53_9BACT|nr:chitosanase [Chitinophaga arvensicola]SEW53956.1 chitosanase [Chitinophaga arvensicola]